MCVSRIHRVSTIDHGVVMVTDAEGRTTRVSLLAWEGPPPGVGDWVAVQSGYALGPADEEEAVAAMADLQRARDLGAKEARHARI